MPHQHGQRRRHRHAHPRADSAERAHVHAEPERGHRENGEPAGRRAGDVHRRRWHQADRAEQCQRQEADDEPGDEAVERHSGARRSGRPDRVNAVGAVGRSAVQHREPDHHRAEQQHAHELHQRADLPRDHAHRKSRGEYLRHRVDGEAGHHAVGVVRERERLAERREAEHQRHAEHRREPDRRRHIVRLGADHRGHGGDGGVAADRVAAGEEDGDRLAEAEQPTDAVARAERGGDGEEDAEQQQRAGAEQERQVERGAEQHDGHLEQNLRAEADARCPARAGPPRRPDDRPDQDGEDDRLHVGVAECGGLESLDEH